MGYFSSGSEGMDYEARYCERCIHYNEHDGCPVMRLHFEHNYEECDKPDSFLHALIPMDSDRNNQQCTMFVEAR